MTNLIGKPGRSRKIDLPDTQRRFVVGAENIAELVFQPRILLPKNGISEITGVVIGHINDGPFAGK